MTKQLSETHDVRAADGKRLAVDVSGDPEGFPIFLMHGTPGSRLGPKPRSFRLFHRGLRLVTYDRPGYGGSERRRGRRVADAAADVRAIADALGLDCFAVVGRSGGGPHALACAALLPERVTRTALLVSLAPVDADDLDWYQDMGDLNVREYTSIDADDSEWLSHLADWAEQTREDPASLLDNLQSALTSEDRRVVEDPVYRRMLLATYGEAVEKGPAGWQDDALAFRREWGFDIRRIPGEVRLWHGAEDRFSPVHHTRWLAHHLPRGEACIMPGAGHFSAMEILPEVLTWLEDGPRRPQHPVTLPGSPFERALVPRRPRTGQAGRARGSAALPDVAN